MPPDERRAAIIAAARPLVLEHGMGFTTRQVAEAACIAEGTIFRVFDTKQDLLWAVIDDAMDPAPTCDAIAALPRTDDLVELVAGMIEALQRAIVSTSRLFGALHARPPAPISQVQSNEHQDADKPPRPQPPSPELARARAEALVDAVTARLRWFEPTIRIPLDEAASLIRSMAFASSHPFLSDGRLLDPRRLADVMVKGLAEPASDASHLTDTLQTT